MPLKLTSFDPGAIIFAVSLVIIVLMNEPGHQNDDSKCASLYASISGRIRVLKRLPMFIF